MTDAQADRYYGDEVANYEAKRHKQRTWRLEHAAVKKILNGFPNGRRVLDVPVGTGRFFQLYKRRSLDVYGADISAHMVAESQRQADDLGLKANLTTGSILDLPYSDDTFDIAVCVRMLQWLTPADTDTAIGELARVTRGPIIVTAHHKVIHWPTPTAKRTREAEQKKVRSKKRRGKQVMTIHRRNDLMRSFARHGLEVKQRELLVRKPGWYQYNVWVLQRRT